MIVEIDRDYVHQTLMSLVRLNSINPSLVADGEGEANIAAYVAATLDRLGLSVDVHEVADHRPNVVATLKGSGGGKSLLLDLARRRLPESVWNRPKHGFSTPLGSYFTGAWQSVCDEAVAAATMRAPFLNAAAVRALWQSARAGRGSRRLAYAFIVLLIWLDRHRLDPY